jgi:hypothetical protein
MTSTFTTPLGFEKPGLNDYFNTWHTPANLNYDLIAAAIGGTTDLALTEDTTLTNLDGAADQSRAAILNITSSDQHDRVITVPAEGRLYVVRNASAFRVKIRPAAGTATDIMPGTIADVMVTATHCYRRSVSGWGLHSTVATTSGTSATFTFTGLGQHFTDLQFIFAGASGASGNFTYVLRTDAAAGHSALDTGISSTTAQNGSITIPNYRADRGGMSFFLGADAASPATGSAAAIRQHWRVTGGIGSVVFALTGGASFNAGSISAYLR